MNKTSEEYYEENLSEYLRKRYNLSEAKVFNDSEFSHAWYKHNGKQVDEIRELVSIIDRTFNLNGKLARKYMSSTITLDELEVYIKDVYQRKLAASIDSLIESIGCEGEAFKIVTNALEEIQSLLVPRVVNIKPRD